MNYYNKKCSGCGGFFSKDEKNPSYVKNPDKNTLYCKRCFRLKNYGILDNSNVNDEFISERLSEIDFNLGSTILVVDFFNITDSLMEQFKNNKNLLLVVNKINFLNLFGRTEQITERIKTFIKDLGWNQQIIFYDSVNKINIKTINDWITKKSKNNKVYIVGKTNVGKSSLINALLKFNKKEPILLVSPIKNTTVNLRQIQLTKFSYLIDTPGFENNNNFLSLIKNGSNEKMNLKKMVWRSFLLKDENQIFFLEALARFEPSKLIRDSKSSISFLTIDKLKLHRTNIRNKEKIINSKETMFNFFLETDIQLKETIFSNLKKDNKYNIFINGIGLISIKNVQEIKISFPEHLEVELLEKFII